MAPNTILAVAVGGKVHGHTHQKCFPYFWSSAVHRWIDFWIGLNGYELPTSYVIEYHHYASKLDAFF